jgi:hypothetical protein
MSEIVVDNHTNERYNILVPWERADKYIDVFARYLVFTVQVDCYSNPPAKDVSSLSSWQLYRGALVGTSPLHAVTLLQLNQFGMKLQTKLSRPAQIYVCKHSVSHICVLVNTKMKKEDFSGRVDRQGNFKNACQ